MFRDFIKTCFFWVLGITYTVQGQSELLRYIQIPPQELSAKQYLFHIEEQTGYNLAFSSAIVEDRRIALHTDSLPLHILLDTLFTKVKVNYLLEANTLILSPVEEMKAPETIRLFGQIINSRTSRPIPFASVYLLKSNIGTMSNHQGGFSILIPSENFYDTMVISCLGYGQIKINQPKNTHEPLIIELKPINYNIGEIVIRAVKPKELILSMIEKKGGNYSSKTELLTAFFRETSQQNTNYILISEAVIDIYKTPYQNVQDDLVKLRKGRKGANAKDLELINLIVEGGLYNNIRLDLMKYGADFLDPRFFNYYDYTFSKIIYHNQRAAYVIEFKQNAGAGFIAYDGKLFIDEPTLALVRAEFSISPMSLDFAQLELVKKTPANFKVKLRSAKYEVEYRFYDGIWNLAHARGDVSLKIRKNSNTDEKGFSCLFNTSSEFVVTQKNDTLFERIKFRDAAKPEDILFQQISNTDAEFWGTENTIVPEEPLLETISKLIRFEKGADKKQAITKNKK